MKKIFSALALFLLISSAVYAADDTSKTMDPSTQKFYNVIYRDILSTNPSLGTAVADWEAKTILNYSTQYGVHPFLVAANFHQESRYSMQAYSSTGAIGIAQLMPQTAAAIGVNPYDPEQNIRGGVIYLAQQLRNFSGCGAWASTYAIAAYNAGPEAVMQYRGVPPYAETINHVNAVSWNMRRLIAAFQAS